MILIYEVLTKKNYGNVRFVR